VWFSPTITIRWRIGVDGVWDVSALAAVGINAEQSQKAIVTSAEAAPGPFDSIGFKLPPALGLYLANLTRSTVFR